MPLRSEMLRVYWDSRRWVRLQSEKAMEDEGSLDTTTRLAPSHLCGEEEPLEKLPLDD